MTEEGTRPWSSVADEIKQAEHERLQIEARMDFTPTEDKPWSAHSLSSCWCCCDDCDPGPADLTTDEFARLLEESSLGTPNARAIQARAIQALNTEEKKTSDD
jgi:hypothetical protein